MSAAVSADPIELTLPWPPSVNAYWRAWNRRVVLSSRAKKYHREVREVVADAGWPSVGTSRCRVAIELFPPDQRVRDIDNALKAILDALEAAQVWADDGQIDELRMWRADRRADGAVRVLIEVI